jgi:hypothetical protein
MKFDKFMLLTTLGTSLFVGFIIVAIGIGAIFPSMHKLTAPFICNGEVQVESIRYSYKPGQVGWEHHIYCTSDGVQKEITFPAIGMTGLVASAIIFAYLAFRWRNQIILPENFGSLAADLKPVPPSPSVPKKSNPKKQGSPLERLSELKKMRDENLISEAEYERKKNEIMEEL